MATIDQVVLDPIPWVDLYCPVR